ncbi:hypothetical protein [Methylobacterium sp. ARG-1]|uniref:DUF6894 family protein n=1 Tax=Methylobacterium sp. ARG-1 TaxID=1692501 RepID=UPI0006832D93|nr:hypothetical protein [Methylobacterium sp. ARG-1]KNY23750.1 hypothetical protein AKJ13_04485 [Methylobacterium sp. ARG-1]
MRYFTDFITGTVLSRDGEGLEFCGQREACQSAAEALVEVANDTLRRKQTSPVGTDLADLYLEAQVRNEAGTVVFRAQLTVALDWPDTPAGQG